MRGVGADVAEPDAAEACVAFAAEAFGSLDILVDDAGTNPAHDPIVDQDRALFLEPAPRHHG